MDWRRHEELFSKERMKRFLFACNHQVDGAIKLYKYNIQASQALYPMLSIFEVSLRNALDRVISQYLNDKDWLVTQRLQFATHPLMAVKDSRGILIPDTGFDDKLKRTEYWLRIRNQPVTHEKLLTGLMFGFWLKFFEANSIKCLKGAPLMALINKPSKSVTAIRQHFKTLQLTRNRIAHYEPICFDKGGGICLESLANYEANIADALHWLDTDLTTYIDKLNFYKLVFNRIAALYHSLPHASSSA